VRGVLLRIATRPKWLSSLQVLGAWLDAILAGATEYDAADIVEVIARRPGPSYEERRAVFKPTGRPEPSRVRRQVEERMHVCRGHEHIVQLEIATAGAA
jgi:hypothetical protein